MPMPLNSAGATQAALNQAQKPQAPQQPANPQNLQQPQQSQGQQFGSDPEIAQNLEAHLSQLPDKQKMFLAAALQHNANIVIPVLGIVCGQEVFDYFVNLYKQHFMKPGQQQQGQQLPQSAPHPATGQQPNSAPAQATPNMGQAPQQPPIQQSPQ